MKLVDKLNIGMCTLKDTGVTYMNCVHTIPSYVLGLGQMLKIDLRSFGTEIFQL